MKLLSQFYTILTLEQFIQKKDLSFLLIYIQVPNHKYFRVLHLHRKMKHIVDDHVVDTDCSGPFILTGNRVSLVSICSTAIYTRRNTKEFTANRYNLVRCYTCKW